MTRQEIIDFCLTFTAAYKDYPFDHITDGSSWTVMRHRANKKSFALIYTRNGRLCVNLKCDPFEADFLRQVYPDVTPAYHMNKVHWNTVALDGKVPEEEIERMVRNSYDLIKPKMKGMAKLHGAASHKKTRG